jgi:hypothetical protein
MTQPAAVIVLAYLAFASTTPSTDPLPVPGSDSVTRSWSARAALATKRLQAGGLDACDRAVETAFAGAKASCAFDLCPGDPLAGAPCP